MAASSSTTLSATARYLGGRIHSRELDGWTTVATSPLTLRGREGGYFVVFRFGVLVGVGTAGGEMDTLARMLSRTVAVPESGNTEESADLRIDTEAREEIGPDGEIVLRSLDVERAQTVGNALAKSAVLGHYEEQVAQVFDQVERLALQLRDGAPPTSTRDLMRQIGNVLLIQTHMVGRVEVAEKPELTWENPELDLLYQRLSQEYELPDRDLALSRKLELISNVAGTYLELLDTRKSLRVEWYIVILIVAEIVFFIVWEFMG